jgi:hypothetical protein
MSVFKNRIPRRIFGCRGVDVSGEWKKLHNEEINDLYSLPNIIWVIKLRRMRWVGQVAHMRRKEVHTGFCWGRPVGRRPFGRPRHRWGNNIKMDL